MGCDTSSTWAELIIGLAPFPPASLHARRIVLLVDNDHADLLTASRILERCGCVLLRVEGPQQAIALLERYGDLIDLLITDLNMLEKFGLAECLRQWCPSLPVLFVSAASFTEGFQNNCCFIEKPFSVWGLIESVAAVLNAPDLIKRARSRLAH